MKHVHVNPAKKYLYAFWLQIHVLVCSVTANGNNIKTTDKISIIKSIS